MKIIVGLGNIGKTYENTRHNAGFMVMDAIAEMCRVEWNQEKFSAYFIKCKYKGQDIILLKPTTYMNNSGIAIRACMDYFKVSPKDILVIYDDVDLPVGRLRLRQKGSSGGHNGIKSIIQYISTQTFDRIRLGVGKDPQIAMIDWVLSRFRPEEKEDLAAAVKKAAEAALYALDHDFIDTMNHFNGNSK